MSWPDEDDLFESDKSEKIHRKTRKHSKRSGQNGFEDDAQDDEYRHKRAGKRAHRKKTHKDEFLPGGDN